MFFFLVSIVLWFFQGVDCNAELHENLFGLQRGPHQRAASKARRLALSSKGEDKPFASLYESHEFNFKGPYPGKGFLDHSHSVVFKPGTSFMGDWSDVVSSVTCERGGVLPGRHYRPRGPEAHTPDGAPYFPGEEDKFDVLPSITLTVVLSENVGPLKDEFLEAMQSSKVLILDQPVLDASPSCRGVLDIRLGGKNFSPIFRLVTVASGGQRLVRLLTEPGALLEPFIAATWKSSHTPDLAFALQNRSETLFDHLHVLTDILSSDAGRRALAGDQLQCTSWKTAINLKMAAANGGKPCPSGWSDDGLTCREPIWCDPIGCHSVKQCFWYGRCGCWGGACHGGRITGKKNVQYLIKAASALNSLPCTNEETLNAPRILPGISVNYNPQLNRATTPSIPLFTYDSTKEGGGDEGFQMTIQAGVSCENCYLYYNHTLNVGLEFCAWGHFSFGALGAISIGVPEVFKGCLQMDAQDDYESWKTHSGFGDVYANYHLWIFAQYKANFGVGATLKMGLNVTGQAQATFKLEPKNKVSPGPNPTKEPSENVDPKPIEVEDLYTNTLDMWNNPKSAFEQAKAAKVLAKQYKKIYDGFAQPKPKSKSVRITSAMRRTG